MTTSDNANNPNPSVSQPAAGSANDPHFESALEDTLQDGLAPSVITVTGPDRPGVSAAFFRVLSSYGVQLLDIEQSVFRGKLSLAALVGVGQEDLEPLGEGLKETLASYGTVSYTHLTLRRRG